MADGVFDIGTDVAHFLIFHPDDLAHRADDPIAWYGYDFAYEKEARAGRLMGWCTGSDGGYRIRMTLGELSDEEAAAACPHWSFPLVVRHGRVLLDNTDSLPGDAQMVAPDKAETWFALDNGNYRVTVVPIARGRDPDLADYVVRFEPVAALAWVPPAPTPVELQPFKDWEPKPVGSMEDDGRYGWPDDDDVVTEGLPVFVVGESEMALPRLGTSMFVEEPVADLVFPPDRSQGYEMFFITDKDEVGQPGVLAYGRGRSQSKGQLPRITLQGTAIGRIEQLSEGAVLPLADVNVFSKPDMTAPDDVVEAFRATALAAAEAGQLRSVSSFEKERLAALRSAEAITGWTLERVGLPLGQRLGIYGLSAKDRIKALREVLA